MTESISRKFSRLGLGVSETGTLTVNSATATKWATARTLTLGGDLSGNVSIDGSENVTLTATVSGNTVALGTDTTGDYVATVSAGTGITTTGTGESAAVTISIDNTVATLTGAQTLTNKTISGSNNTITNIGNGSLTNSSVTVNGTSIALGSSGTLVTDDIAEDASPVNLWFTNARARGAVSATDAGGDGSFTYDSGTGVFTYTGPSATEVRAHLSAGTGLTFTTGQFAIDGTVVTLTGSQTLTNKTLTSPIISSITNTGTLTLPTSTDTLVGRATTDTLTNKTISGADNTISNIGNSSLTNSSITINGTATSLGGTRTLVTDDIAEDGTPVNLWYTDGRARAAISVTDAGGDGSLSYSSGVITYTGPSATEVRAHFTAGTGVSITSGQVAIGQAVGTSDNVTFAGVTADNIRVGVTGANEIDTSSGNLTLDSASGTTTVDDNATITGNLQVDGNLTVSGTTVTINATNLAVEDNMIYLNNGSAVTNPDLGIAGNYNDGTYRHAGLFRDATDGVWKFFHQYTPEPDASAYIDTAHASFALANVQAASFTGSLTGNASTASALATARNISLTGDVTGSASFDGSAAVSITATIAADSVALGTDTTGNYVASITNGNYITGGNGGSEGAALTLAVDATSSNTASKVVARDSSGNFSAGTITATLSGNASTVTNGVYTTDTGTVTNTMLAGSIANNKLANSTISGVALGSNLGTLTMGVSGTGLSGSQTYNGSGAATFTVTSNATSANTASTIVARDSSGNFTAGTITAALSGNATTTSQRNFSSDISTTGQGRFTGWYSGNAATGFATEAGISGGEGYLIAYNRDTSSYGNLNINAVNIKIAPQGGSLTGPSGNVILHAGNYTSYTYTFDSLTSKASGTGTYTTSGDFRAPIFYDSNNTAYYVDPNSTSRLSQINLGAPSTRIIAHSSAQGYTYFYGSASNYLAIGPYENNGWAYFESVGNANGMYFSVPSGGNFRFDVGSILPYDDNEISLGSSGLRFTTLYLSSTGQSAGDFRAPIFYDSNNTGYYIDPNTTATSVYVRGEIQNPSVWINDGDNYNNYNENIRLFNAPNGVSVIAFSASGTGGMPTTSILGYSSYMERRFNNGWQDRMYDGYVEAAGSYRAPIFYDSNNTGYYLDPASTSNLNSVSIVTLNGHTLNADNYLGRYGNSYYQVQTWLQLNGTHGIYWPSYYGAHLYINQGSTYTQLRFDGSKNGYDGLWLSYSGVNGMMYDSGGNGGVYREANGRWYFYHSVGNNCMGIGTSSTSSTYGVYVVKGGYFDGRVDGTIFYDANNTAYYCDPNGTARLSYVVANGGIRIDGNENLYLDNNYGQSIVGVYTSTRYQGVFAMGNSYKLPIDGSGPGNLYGLTWSHPNAGGVAGNLNTHGLMALENGSWLASLCGSTRARDDMRSPIFYDNNNTGYYVDPNSFSRMDRVDPNEIYNYGWFRNHSDTGWYSQAYGYGAWWAHSAGNSYGNATTYGSGRNGWSGWGIGTRHVFMSTTGDNVGVHDNSRGWIWYWNGSYTEFPYGYTIHGGSSRSPIFYDQNDTGYYVDPASTSYMYRTIFQGRMLFYGADQSADGTNDAQIYFTPGGGLTIASITTTFETGFVGSSYPQNRQAGAQATYDKRFYVWQDLVQYYSDERLKEKTGTLVGALDAIKSWTPFKYVDNALANSFNFGSNKTQIGLSAQEVEAFYPELVELAPFDVENDFSDETNPRRVSKSGENYLTLNYTRLVPILVQAIKEQQAKIEELENRINNS